MMSEMKNVSNEERLIDANELIRKLIEKYHGMISDEELKIYQIILLLDEQPIVDAKEVVHGRWEDVQETTMHVLDTKCAITHTAETCSVCKARVGFVGPKKYLHDKMCPECGAIMDS